VSQGRGPKYSSPKSTEFEDILDTVRKIITKTGIKPCCALGEVTPEQASALKEAGVTRYNHNLEASENFFPEIVTTHSWRDRVQTIKNLKAAGIQACTGGILGLGESWELQALGLKSGMNAMLIGHYLTTMGQPPEQDHAMLESLGLKGGEAPIPGEYHSHQV
jgi:biotin synthase-like enzyme